MCRFEFESNLGLHVCVILLCSYIRTIYVSIYLHISYTQTPVHFACELASKADTSKEIFKLLLCHGGDLYQRDNKGLTPLNLLQLIDDSLYTTIVEDYCSKLLLYNDYLCMYISVLYICRL